jgi:hypothetical protein
MRFATPPTRPHTEWSLIGGEGAVSPFHIDSEGMAPAVLVLEGGKYWIFRTGVGDDDNICSVDSLGPNWDPYCLNVGDNANCFCFEAVHLKKGDMM